MSAKESYMSAKESDMSAKESYISAKESDMSAKESYMSAKESKMSGKGHHESTKRALCPEIHLGSKIKDFSQHIILFLHSV